MTSQVTPPMLHGERQADAGSGIPALRSVSAGLTCCRTERPHHHTMEPAHGRPPARPAASRVTSRGNACAPVDVRRAVLQRRAPASEGDQPISTPSEGSCSAARRSVTLRG